ncbi:MAG: hypothetical protein MMC23_003571 [Stictis urceolatum]|nr:hypothetical protein [Stictis urceolata]
MIGITAIVTPNPDKVEDVRKGLKDLADKVKANEPDTLRYKITEQINAEGTPLFVVVEEYKDEAAVDKHMNSEYFKELGAAIKDQNLLAKPLDIMKTKVIGGYDSKL